MTKHTHTPLTATTKILIIVLNVVEPVDKADLGILFKGYRKLTCITVYPTLNCLYARSSWNAGTVLELQLSRGLHCLPALCSRLTLRALEVADSSPSCGFVHTVHTLTVGISSVKEFSL